LLAWSVLRGRVPREVERRRWVRSIETPVLVEAHDWVEGRLLFSVLVWPSLEEEDPAAHWERVEQVKRAISRGAAELMWSTEITTDYSLRWNADRAVWTTEDATSFDGGRFSEYARGTDVA
jgi:hypothetical protein